MGMLGRLRSTWIEIEATSRLLKHAPRLLPGGAWNASALVAQNAKAHGERTAILYQDARFSWRDVDTEVARYSSFFASRGIGPGDVVALLMDNRPEFVFIETALCRLGAVSALINTHLSGHALEHAIEIGRPKLCVVGSEHAAKLREVFDSSRQPGANSGGLSLADNQILVQQETPGDSPCGFEPINSAVAALPGGKDSTKTSSRDGMCYIYTSGTTGLPKAAIVTHHRFLLAAHLFGEVMHECKLGDVIYVTLPLYHSNAQWAGWGACCATGATMALRRKFSASAFWEDVRKYDATHFIYIGELCRYLLNQPPSAQDSQHRIRVGVGNGLRPDIWSDFTRRFSVPVMREFYGATEGNAPMFNVEGRPGMVGRLRPGQILVHCDLASGEIRRNDKGLCEQIEPAATGLLLGKINIVTKFDGYVDTGATEKKIVRDVLKPGDAYFNSGDLLTLHDDNWVSFADRVGDTFRWKGENVSTNEVAEIINGAPGVLESNVYGVSVSGADGRAGMASLNTSAEFSLDTFAQFILDKLPGYQRPYFIRVQSDMRITQTFKHQKVDYREEGYDPRKVNGDKLYFLDGERYVPIDAQVHDRLIRGDLAPR